MEGDAPKRVRTCIGCGAKGPKDGFRRLALDGDGSLVWDRTGRGAGRGAYVCGADCLRQAASKGRLSRALRRKVGAEQAERAADEMLDAS